MARPVAGNVSENTKHHLEMLDKYRDQPEYSYRTIIGGCQLYSSRPVDPKLFESAFTAIIQLSPVLDQIIGEVSNAFH